MPIKELKHVVKDAETGRIDSLVARLLGFSRARVRGLVAHGGVMLNGLPCLDVGAQVSRADTLTIHFDPERRYREKAAERNPRGFRVVFLDDHLVVVDKEAGILTVPTPKGERNTLIDLLSRYLAKGQKRRRLVSVVHRLDRETSGLLVFGRDSETAKDLIAQFAARKPTREYAAIVAGRVASDQDTISSHLATDKSLNQKSVASSQGELAVTHFKVQARYRDATLLAVKLETGRRNQIRVHVAEMGHPVLGDTRYLPKQASHPLWPHKRLALHARILGFRHPVTRQDLYFESALPNEFHRFRT